MTKNITFTVNDTIKCVLLLIMCRSVVSNANPRLDNIFSKMCSVLKLPRFCLPSMLDSYPYPFYTLPVAPFPLIANPTTSALSFTIPTVFTTNRPPSAGGPPFLPGPSPSAPPSGSQCPPSPPICPPAALSMPFIDPRQGIYRNDINCYVTFHLFL